MTMFTRYGTPPAARYSFAMPRRCIFVLNFDMVMAGVLGCGAGYLP
jgi:hypothetical protein